MKKIIKKILLKPPFVKYCSQTIYQAMLGSIKLYEATNDLLWKEECDYLLKILLSIQRPDGGFDIGYEFNFGLLHKKGDSTSPEMIGLLALLEYKRVFGLKEEIETAISIAIGWIENNYTSANEKHYFPYSPMNTKEQMVYNGSSFVIGGLGVYLGENSNKNLQSKYQNVISYLNTIVYKTSNGGYFYYYDQDRDDVPILMRDKVDFYHQAQQIEMHCYAQLASPIDEQLDMIKITLDYLEFVYNKDGLIPYTKDNLFFGGNIHVWGYVSTISAFIMGAKLFPEKKKIYLFYAENIATWIIKRSFNGRFFIPIVKQNGDAIYDKYMVRSDAWVFNSLASLYSEKKSPDTLNVLNIIYQKMRKVDFSGRETHASNQVTRQLSGLISKFNK